MAVQEPVELVKEAWRRYAVGGVAGVEHLLAPDVVWVPHDRDGVPVRGRAALMASSRAMAMAGTRVEAFGHRFEDHGDCVVVAGRVRVLGPDGLYDVPMNWQVDVRDGRISAVRAERSLEQAREDCGSAAA